MAIMGKAGRDVARRRFEQLAEHGGFDETAHCALRALDDLDTLHRERRELAAVLGRIVDSAPLRQRNLVGHDDVPNALIAALRDGRDVLDRIKAEEDAP